MSDYHEQRLAKRMADPEFVAAYAAEMRRQQRKANRPFRRAFGRGEGWRKRLLAVGEFNARMKEES